MVDPAGHRGAAASTTARVACRGGRAYGVLPASFPLLQGFDPLPRELSAGPRTPARFLTKSDIRLDTEDMKSRPWRAPATQ
jgi:hypothetical protein